MPITYEEVLSELKNTGIDANLLNAQCIRSPEREKIIENLKGLDSYNPFSFYLNVKRTSLDRALHLSDYEPDYICVLYTLIVIRKHTINDAVEWSSRFTTHFQAGALNEILAADKKRQFSVPDIISELIAVSDQSGLDALEKTYIYGMRAAHFQTWNKQSPSFWFESHGLVVEALHNDFRLDIDSIMQCLLQLPHNLDAENFLKFLESLKKNPAVDFSKIDIQAIINELRELSFAQREVFLRLYHSGLQKKHLVLWNEKYGKEFFDVHHRDALYVLMIDKKLPPDEAVHFLYQIPDPRQTNALIELLKLRISVEDAVAELTGLEFIESVIIEKLYQYGIRKEHVLLLREAAKKSGFPINFCHFDALKFLLRMKKKDAAVATSCVCRVFNHHQLTLFLKLIKNHNCDRAAAELENLSEPECAAIEVLYNLGLRPRHLMLWRDKRPAQPFSDGDFNLLRSAISAHKDKSIRNIIENLLSPAKPRPDPINPTIDTKKTSAFFLSAEEHENTRKRAEPKESQQAALAPTPQ